MIDMNVSGAWYANAIGVWTVFGSLYRYAGDVNGSQAVKDKVNPWTVLESQTIAYVNVSRACYLQSLQVQWIDVN